MMCISVHKTTIFTFVTLICVTHMFASSDLNFTSSISSRDKRQSEDNCGHLKQLLSEEKSCFVNHFEVTCPNSAKSGTVIRKNCKRFYRENNVKSTSYSCQIGEWIRTDKGCLPECGKKSDDKFPWTVGIYDSTTKLVCSGTIISPHHVLTAAHCFPKDYNEPNSKNSYTVTAGGIQRDINIKQKGIQTRKIKTLVLHEDYSTSKENHSNNLALLELSEAFELSFGVLPVCIDWNSSYEEFDFVNGNEGVVESWEFTKENEIASHVLREQYVAYWERESCWRNLSQEYRGYFTDDKLCVAYLNKSANVCSEDIGGGLFFQSDRDKFFIRGVLSSTLNSLDTCNSSNYSLYTAISNSLAWLKFQMQEDTDFHMDSRTSRSHRDTDFDRDFRTSRSYSCLLPEHVQYGKFLSINGKPYIANTLTPSNTNIELQCTEEDRESDPLIFICLRGKWIPSIEDARCKKPGSCSSIKDSISEEVFCNLDERSVSCETAENNTVAIVNCQPYYTSNRPRSVYKCENGKWNQTFIHCIPECGLKETSVTSAGSKETYPWVVSIYSPFNEFVCFGTIISPYHVLTAAYCIRDFDGRSESVADYTIVANKLYERTNISEEPLQRNRIKNLKIRSDRTENYDIALIELQKGFIFSPTVRPVCVDWSSLFEKSDLEDGNEGIIIGRYPPAGSLQSINVTYKRRCRNRFPLFELYLTNDKLCIRHSDTNLAFSNRGGGLFFKSDGTKYFIRGISSNDELYYSDYSYYTKVSDHLMWLIYHLEENKNLHMEFVTEDTKAGCILPEHGAYGQFKMLNDEPYNENKLIANSSYIILSCIEREHENSGILFKCVNKEWTPSIKSRRCKKPGSCPPLKTSLTEEVICKLDDRPIDCEEPENNTVAVVNCRPFYDNNGNMSIYNCINGSWDPSFTSCSPECGIQRPTITTAGETVKNEYPWVVAIYLNDQLVCSGTIISRYYLLAAAHCFTTESADIIDKDNFTIIAGKYNKYINIHEESSQRRNIKSLSIPEDYRGKALNHRDDIALVEVDKKFTLSLEVEPVCVDWDKTYEKSDFTNGKEGVIAGWTSTVKLDPASDVLEKFTATYKSEAECSQYLPDGFAHAYFTSDKFCAGHSNKNAIVCNRGSGGGLFFKSDSKKFFIRGISSIIPKSNAGCESNSYILYTKVSKYLTWIRYNTHNEI